MAVVAIDAGGTRIKLGVVERGAVLARTMIEARSGEGLAPQLPRIADAVRGLLPSGAVLEGVGMAFPSLVDVASGRILGHSGKYEDAPDLDLPAWCRREFDLPFAVENDARMATIGEWRHGVGKGCDDLVMVTLGTGIGTGVVLGGRVLRGRHGQAGCLGGHLTAHIGGHPCGCGGFGCAEAEASTAALPRLAAEDPDFAASSLRAAAPLDYAAVFAAAAQGDPCAKRLRDRSLAVWSALSVSLIHAYDPEMLIFGGGIAASGEATLGPIRQYVERYAWTPWGKVRVVASELGADAALIACEWLVASRNERNHEIAFA
jgi:glucokinase